MLQNAPCAQKPRRGVVPQTRGFVQEDEPPIRHGGEAQLDTKPASVAIEGRGVRFAAFWTNVRRGWGDLK